VAGGPGKRPGFSFVISYFLGFFIYISMFIYGAIVMRSVIEEKTSRVIESVISSVKPFHLMAGKIFGVGAVGLTQILIWALAMGLLSLYGLQIAAFFMSDPSQAQSAGIPTVSLVTLGFFVLFFVLGYFLYSTLYAGIGALVNSEQEAQQFLMPIGLVIAVPIIMMMYVITNPSSQTSVIMSLVPFFTPIIMLARIAVETPPVWQIIASIILMVLAILGMIWIVGRIYRVGVLMYGKRPTLPEIIKWIKYA
jgi:ABC-2 type transport system permease protein